MLVAPIWTTQTWSPQLLHLLSQPSYYLPNTKDILRLLHKPDYVHLLKKLILGVFRLSGSLCAKGIQEQSAKIIVDGWRKSTQKQYASFIKRWLHFCNRKSNSETKPNIYVVLEFLTDLYE